MTRKPTGRTALTVVLATALAGGTLLVQGPASAAVQDDIPTVTALFPSSGALDGGDVVSITGSNFLEDLEPAVSFNGTALPPADVIVVSDTRIVVKTPATGLREGVQDVLVTNTVGENLDTPADDFTGVAASTTDAAAANKFFTITDAATSTVVTVTRGSAAGGNLVHLTGKKLQKANKVTFGGISAAIVRRATAKVDADGAGAGTALEVRDRLTVRVPAHVPTLSTAKANISVFTPKDKKSPSSVVTELAAYQYDAVITGASVLTGKAGTVTVLRGVGFDALPETGGIALAAAGTASPTPIAANSYFIVSDTEIVVTVPTGTPNGVYAWYTTIGGAGSNKVESTTKFTVTS